MNTAVVKSDYMLGTLRIRQYAGASRDNLSGAGNQQATRSSDNQTIVRSLRDYTSDAHVTTDIAKIESGLRSDAKRLAEMTGPVALQRRVTKSYVASLSTGFTLKAIQTAFGACWFGTEHVDLIVSDQNSWDQFWTKMQPLQRMMEESSDVAKIGFQSFRFNGAQVSVDQYCPSGEMFGLNTNPENLLFYISTLQRYQFGFTGWKESQNTDDRAGQHLFSGNLLVPASRFNFHLTSIPTA